MWCVTASGLERASANRQHKQIQAPQLVWSLKWKRSLPLFFLLQLNFPSAFAQVSMAPPSNSLSWISPGWTSALG